MRVVLLPLLLVLAACTTPQEACQRQATEDLRTVDRLIAETEETLRRGFAVDREPYVSSGIDFCIGNGVGVWNGGVGLSYCNRVETRYREVPRAIDRRTEQRKLAELRQTRQRLARETQAALARCAAAPQ